MKILEEQVKEKFELQYKIKAFYSSLEAALNSFEKVKCDVIASEKEKSSSFIEGIEFCMSSLKNCFPNELSLELSPEPAHE